MFSLFILLIALYLSVKSFSVSLSISTTGGKSENNSNEVKACLCMKS